MRSLLLTMTLSLAPALASASTHFPDPRLAVNPVSSTEFEVIEARGAGARDMWCAAARYAHYALGRDRGRIWVAVSRGPAKTVSKAKGVTFTTDDIGSSATPISVSVRHTGQSLPLNHALQFCNDYLIEPDDRY